MEIIFWQKGKKEKINHRNTDYNSLLRDCKQNDSTFDFILVTIITRSRERVKKEFISNRLFLLCDQKPFIKQKSQHTLSMDNTDILVTKL